MSEIFETKQTDNSVSLAPNGFGPAIEAHSESATAKTVPAHIHDHDDNKLQLKRNLNLWNGVSIIIGIIVGSGIFVSPKGVLVEAGSIGSSLAVWALCGLLALLGALCFAELGTSISASGGDYTYIGLAYGPLASFLYIWVISLILIPCSNAITALTFANYVLQPIYSGCLPSEHAIRSLSLAILLLLVYINCTTIKGSIVIQNWFTLFKVAALTLIVSFGLYNIFSGRAEGFQSSENVWRESETSASHLARAVYSGFFTYAGWNSLNFVTEELKDPVKNMPRAIILSITTITLIYMLTNAAYFAVLTKSEIIESDAIAVIFGKKMLPFALWLMPLFVALSSVGGLNGGIFASSRIMYVAARQGQLPASLNMINVNNLTPLPSLFFMGALSAAYLCTTDISTLINCLVFIEALFAALAVSTVIKLRHQLPNIPRPLKVPTVVPVLYLLLSILMLVLPVWTSPLETLVGTCTLLAGIPVYYLTAGWKDKPERYRKFIDKFNLLVQVLTFSATPVTANITVS